MISFFFLCISGRQSNWWGLMHSESGKLDKICCKKVWISKVWIRCTNIDTFFMFSLIWSTSRTAIFVYAEKEKKSRLNPRSFFEGNHSFCVALKMAKGSVTFKMRLFSNQPREHCKIGAYNFTTLCVYCIVVGRNSGL